jgi:hypothetical protein
MKTFRNLFFLFFFLLVSLTFHSFNQISDQDKKEQELITKANLYQLRFPQEKIYLHLDRPSYWASEDIWVKAYLLNSAIPDCNVYVELIHSSGEIIDKKILWAQNGLAYGDFHLPDTISSGSYQIRAYTNWMRNFGEEWFFRKDIIILNLRDKSIKSDLLELKSKEIDLQFFPEGGTFVAGVENKLAFKAVDKNGKGIPVEGKIVDKNGNSITTFKSAFKGMGNIDFTPKEREKYTAQAFFTDDISVKVELLVPQIDAVKLTVNPNDSVKIQFQISRNSVQPENSQKNEYLLIGQTGGQVCFRKQIALTEKTTRFEVDKNLFPTGIVKFTLFDNEMIPNCERLVFVNHRDFVKIEIETDKPDYLTREMVQLDIKAFTNAGKACQANLSMSVYNPENSLETEKYPKNILTQFLLDSELKGTIEDPAFYFKDDSISTLQALDNLMLTHGYRYFEWKEIKENKLPEIEYQPENSIQLRGQVKNWLTEKPIKNSNVTMMFVKSQLAVHNQKTDSLGNFVFSDMFFMDTVYVSLQAGNKKERRNNWIELDNKSSKSPKPGILPVNYQYYNENQFTTSYYLSETSSELINRKWSLSDTILLGDVNILAKKHKKDDGHFRPYLEADYVIDAKKLNEETGSIYDAIDGKIAGLRTEITEGGNIVFMYRMYPVSLYLDGTPVDYDLLSTFSSSTFDKVEFLKYAPFAGINKSGGVLYFYTKRGQKFENMPTDAMGLKSARIIGYSVFRRFYSPVYETRQPVDDKKDYRSTLYWNPIVRTDSTGVAQVSFFNSDETGNMQIVVEGITTDGKLCRGIWNYWINQ